MTTRAKVHSILVAGLIMSIGIIVLKYIPMILWGSDIRFDASLHITTAMFGLFVLWYFIDQNTKWRMPFILFSLVVIFIVAIQRILVDAHNDVGLLLGFGLSCAAIVIARWEYFRGKIDF